MSAYIVGNKTISAIAKAFVAYQVDFVADDYNRPIQVIVNLNEIRQAIGQSLLNQNYASVNCRYNEDTEVPVFQYEDVEIDEGIVYGCIRCYNYQACETPNYYNSWVYHSLMELERKLLVRFLMKHKMSAPWGYDGHDILD